MLSKPLIITLFVSLTFNCLLGYLSYSFYSNKAVAESQLATAVDANKDLKKSLDKKESACNLQDKIAAENQTEQLQIVEEKDADLNAIDKMASVSRVEENSPKEAENVNKQSNIVSLDGLLPDHLRVLLQDSCNRSKGSACTNP